MIIDFEPGDKVVNPSNKNWGIGQVQSIIKDKVTVIQLLKITPPVQGFFTPVVSGNDIGNLRQDLIARYANA